MKNENQGLKFTKLSIKDYKVFKDFEINFTGTDDKPLPLIVIAGVNGSGKTTILDILGEYEEYNNNVFLGASSYPTKSTNETDKIKISYLLGNDDEQTIYRGFYENDLGEFLEKVVHIDETNLSKLSTHILYIKLGNKIFNNFKKFLPRHIERLVYDKDIQASLVYKELSDTIKNIFNDMNLKIIFSRRDGNKNLFFKNKTGKEFSIDEISTGEQALLVNVLSLYLMDLKNQAILIDEPETSIHPNWQNKILKLYENFAIQNNCQIIIATHSPHIIGSAKNEYLRILTDDENGNIKVIDNVLAYGRDIEWVLTEIMGVSFTRDARINEKIKECQQLLEDEKYDEAESNIDKLEDIIGENDREILSMRNSLEFWRS